MKNSCEDKKIAHLQMIQGIINRMGGNLFYLRGWSITLLVGIFALATSESLNIAKWSLPLFIIMTIIFWVYDAYFLSLERKYRALFDDVRRMEERDVNFSMDVSNYKTHADKTLLACMGSRTLFGFYGILVLAMLIIFKEVG